MSAGLRAVLFSLFCIFDGGQAWTTYCVSTNSSEECRTLDNYVENQSFFRWSDVEFDFEVGRHYLHSQLVLNHSQTNLTLAGVQGDGQVVIHCPVNASFVFKNVVNLSLFNLTIEYCGHLYQWHTHSPTAALVFLGGRNILIQGVTFNSSLGAMHFENVTGEIKVSQSTFYKSSNPYSFITAACNFRFLECNSTSLNVTNSHFIGNKALVGKPRGCHKKNIQAGGAVFSTYCPDINVTFDGVVFQGNKGCFGGGLTLHLGSTKERFKNQVQIRHSSFSNNYALYGAAAVIDIYYNCVQKKSIANLTVLPQLVNIHDTNFISNTGQKNGGALYIRHQESSKLCTAGNVTIEDSKFIRNSLCTVGGVAIFNINYLAYSVTPHVVPQFCVIVTRCLLKDNYLQNNRYNNSGSGAILTERNPHFELHNTSIVRNNCSGVVATASNVIFRGNVEISHNLASSGGGVVLCSGAIMYFSKNANLTIAHNNALHLGGGILVEYACQQAKPICFFQHLHHNKENTTAVVNLVNNTASRSGSNLYGGSVDSCIILNSPQIYDKVDSSRIFDKLFNTDQLDSYSITSTPIRACFCNDDNNTDCTNKSKTLKVAPGGEIHMNLVLVGQRLSPTPGNLAAKPNSGLKLNHSMYVQVSNLNATCTNVTFAIESDRTKKHGKITLSVSTTSDISFTEHLESYMPIHVHVVLMPCSFGFIFNNRRCDCKYLYHYKILCNSSTKTFKICVSSLAWLGTHHQNYTTYLAVSDFCPPAFCHLEETSIHSEHHDLRNQDKKKRCQKNRMGILCGACTPNASLILGSNDCVENCSYRGLFLILLFLVLGLFLVLFLTLFDITVAEGTIGGILFYANVIQINSDVYFSSTKFRRFSLVCKTFIAWLNLDLGIPVCFYPGMNSYDKMWFQYLFPLYIWLIAGAIIFASKKNIKIAALLRSNCIKVLSTLILLSYAKMTRLTMEIFRYHRVYLYPNHNNQSQTYYKWALDGKMDYFSHEHLPLFVTGVVTAVVLAPYMMCLLFIRRLYKHSNYRILWWINKWRPFFDTYVGSYNDKWYCWTGVQLLARIIVLVANEAQSKLLVSSITTLVVVLLLLAMQWWGELKVYRKRWLNLLEGVSLLNLAFLQLAVVYSFKTHSRTMLPHFSVVLTMVLFVGVVIYHGYRQLFSFSYFKERAGMKLISSTSLLPPLDTEETESFPTNSGNGNTSRLSCFTDDREPLLVKDD